jgi:poly(3-hydroxyalkanoate) synthetase
VRYLDKDQRQILNIICEKGLIWSSFANDYLISRELKSLSLLYWKVVSTGASAMINKSNLRIMYQENKLHN